MDIIFNEEIMIWIMILYLCILGLVLYIYLANRVINCLKKYATSEDGQDYVRVICYEIGQLKIEKPYAGPLRCLFMMRPIRSVFAKNQDANDAWWQNHYKAIFNDMQALLYLDGHSELGSKFISYIKEKDITLRFQTNLISIYSFSDGSDHQTKYEANFPFLVCKFLHKFDFDPEIKKLVFTDPRLERTRKVYEIYRDVETGELKSNT